MEPCRRPKRRRRISVQDANRAVLESERVERAALDSSSERNQPSSDSPHDLTPDPLSQLQLIRETMAAAGSFTAVPGVGQIVIGLTAIAAGVIASIQPDRERWVFTWMCEAALAVGIALIAMRRKAKQADQALFSGPGRKFAMSFVPPLLVGAVLTSVFYNAGMLSALPAVWLMCYGTAVITGGAFSVSVVPVMGLCFFTMGALATIVPGSWSDWIMTSAFGGLHIVFGAVIARRYGG